MRRITLLLLSVLLVPAVAHAATCESLTGLTVTGGMITAAQTVAPGAFTPPAGRGGAPQGATVFARLPAFCRVAATLKPSPNSNIAMEAWLPAANWNGKLQVVGNGAFAGTIGFAAMANALVNGYAAASTDTGHTGEASNTFVNHDVVVDFAHRAIHETTVAAKRIVDGFYGSAPRFAYFNGCSTGGRQALTAAQRYPDDFNGIVAGAPASFSSKQTFGQIWIYQATAAPASEISREKAQAIHAAVLEACDANDGVKDGVLENPLTCKWDPAAIACKAGGEDASCLTPLQVDAVRKIYAGASNTRTGEAVFPGFERGSELGWSPRPVGYAVDYFKYIVFKDPQWDPKSLNFDADLAQAAKQDNLIFDATDADLGKFTGRGGRLIMYQGWAEPGIPPRNVVSYYEQVRKKTKDASSAVRLFMVPGMGHCGGGDGTDTFDMVAALDAWVEKRAAPERIAASRVRNGQVERTRPLCAWPKVASYSGSGSTDDEKNFVCK